MAVAPFFKLAGVPVYYRMISEEPVFDLFPLMWDKSEPVVKGLQKELNSPGLFENYEWLAEKKAEWEKTRPPKFPDEKQKS
jgi:hypothetical protein